MGRTLPTFNTYLLAEEEAWRPFRRALRREDRAAFDRLFARVRTHVAEATSVARLVPFDALVMAVLLSQEVELQRLQRELEKMREKLRG